MGVCLHYGRYKQALERLCRQIHDENLWRFQAVQQYWYANQTPTRIFSLHPLDLCHAIRNRIFSLHPLDLCHAIRNRSVGRLATPPPSRQVH